MNFKTRTPIIFFTLIFSGLNSQKIPLDSLKNDTTVDRKLNLKPYIVPAVLISYSIYGIENNNIIDLNLEVREEVEEHIDKKITIDDFSQFAPALTVYALNFSGIKGKNNFRERSVILGTSYLIVGTTVHILKNSMKIERPDRSGLNSFPSGHTATAFAGAEFLWQEYKDVSIWYGITGYIVAAGTGIFRIYNNRHWVTDVAMGAGIGILSTKAAYWIYPFLNKNLFKFKDNRTSALIMPFYTGNEIGFGMVINFK